MFEDCEGKNGTAKIMVYSSLPADDIDDIAARDSDSDRTHSR